MTDADRQAIANDARVAAERCVRTGVDQYNPEVLNTPEHAAWRAAYCRCLLLFSAPADAEGGA